MVVIEDLMELMATGKVKFFICCEGCRFNDSCEYRGIGGCNNWCLHDKKKGRGECNEEWTEEGDIQRSF